MSVMNTSWKTPKSQYFGRNLKFSSDDLTSKYHHSIENLNFHIAQVVSELTQVHEQMSEMNTSWKTPKTEYFGRNPQFSSNDLSSKCHHSIENLILHLTEVLSELTRVYKRMSAANTSWKTPATQCF